VPGLKAKGVVLFRSRMHHEPRADRAAAIDAVVTGRPRGHTLAFAGCSLQIARALKGL